MSSWEQVVEQNNIFFYYLEWALRKNLGKNLSFHKLKKGNSARVAKSLKKKKEEEEEGGKEKKEKRRKDEEREGNWNPREQSKCTLS